MLNLDVEKIVREEVRAILRESLAAAQAGILGMTGPAIVPRIADTGPAPPPPLPAPRPRGRPAKNKANPKPRASGGITGEELAKAAIADVTAGGWTSAAVLAANAGSDVTARQAGHCLQRLAKTGQLVAKGSRRSTRYYLPDGVPADEPEDTGETATFALDGSP